jgi:hypothetical protein
VGITQARQVLQSEGFRNLLTVSSLMVFERRMIETGSRWCIVVGQMADKGRRIHLRITLAHTETA